MSKVLAMLDGTYEIVCDDYSDLAGLVAVRMGEDAGTILKEMSKELTEANEAYEDTMQALEETTKEFTEVVKELEELQDKYDREVGGSYTRVPADDKLDRLELLIGNLTEYINTTKRIDRKKLLRDLQFMADFKKY